MLSGVMMLGLLVTSFPAGYAQLNPDNNVSSKPVSKVIPDLLKFQVFVEVDGKLDSILVDPGVTVQDVLEKGGVTLAGKDQVNMKLDARVSPLSVIIVARMNQVIEAVYKDVDYSTVTQSDKVYCDGESKTVSKGVKGESVTFVMTTTREGADDLVKELNTLVVTEPVDEVIAKCMKRVIPSGGSGNVSAGSGKVSGTKQDWLSAAGIPEDQWDSADKLIQRESSWNPNAVNKSSGACGLVQALPCSKLGPNWNDPVVALKWGQKYVVGRYGSWDSALAHSYSHGWY